MLDAVPHVGWHRVDDTKLRVVADAAAGMDALAAVEKRVIRGFQRHGGWPHKQVNVLVCETLQPLVEQIRAAVSASRPRAAPDGSEGFHFEDLDRKPMVHVYNLADPSECNIFVNRDRLIRLGLWDDALALEGLLAHEHAHPLAENTTTRAARTVSVKVQDGRKPANGGADAERLLRQSAERMAQELCLHAPHEVFSNELAVRAGFGEALLHLDRMTLTPEGTGLAERAELRTKLYGEADAGRMSQGAVALMLLTASFEAHLPMALESAAFLRAGEPERAGVIDALLEEDVFRRLEPEISPLYLLFRERYASLSTDLDAEAVFAWMNATYAPLLEVLDKRGASLTVEFRRRGNQNET